MRKKRGRGATGAGTLLSTMPVTCPAPGAGTAHPPRPDSPARGRGGDGVSEVWLPLGLALLPTFAEHVTGCTDSPTGDTFAK